jgi:hypothetical protein
MTTPEKTYFDVQAREVLQPANSDVRRIFGHRPDAAPPAPLTSALQREEYEGYLDKQVPVTFTVRVELRHLLLWSDSLSSYLQELVFNDEVDMYLCDYRAVGASFSDFTDNFSGHVHLQVSCLLEDRQPIRERKHYVYRQG